MKRLGFLLFIALFVAWAPEAFSQIQVRNAIELRQQLGLNQLPRPEVAQLSQLKIAVLDNDFSDYVDNRDSLPESALYIPGPLRAPNPESSKGHGMLMAQIVWAMSGMRPEGPQFYLIQANGLSNFRAAIDKAIELEVDVVLYANTWETTGNFDGQGFLNAEVSRATDAGILWINAAGNDHGQVFNSWIRVDPDSGQVILPGAGKTLNFSVRYARTPVRLTLSWNDFQNTEEHQTQKDLDWALQDWTGREIPLRNFAQVESRRCQPSSEEEKRAESLHAREQVDLLLDEGVYSLRIIDCSRNFEASDRFRFTIQSAKAGVEFQQAQRSHEIMPPADHPRVITVGDQSPVSSLGPTMDGRTKPDFLLRHTHIEMNDGRQIPGGSSVAAALFAGIVVHMKAHEPKLNLKALQNFRNKLSQEQRLNTQKHGPVWRTPNSWELPTLLW